MNRRRIAAMASGLALILSLQGLAQTPSPQPSASPDLTQAHRALDPNNIDPKVKPGDDFYQYAVGGWLAHHPIPPEYPEWGTFNILAEENTQRLHEILEGLTAAHADPGKSEQKLGDFYRSGMDEAAINRAGARPIEPELKRIDSIRNVAGLEKEVVRLHQYGIPVYFAYGSDQDAKNSNMVIGEIDQAGLGLPDRDYYLKTDPASKKIQVAYRTHVARLLTLAGEQPAAARADAAAIYNYEKTMATHSRTRAELRDPQSNYHKMDVNGVARVAPAFPWKAYLRDAHAPANEAINLGQPAFLHSLDTMWTPSRLAIARKYLRWQFVNGTARYLSTPFVNEDFEFRVKTLTGAKKLRTRWKRVVREIDDDMGEALGQKYVAKYFPPEAKAKALEMVNNLKAALQEDLTTLSWMSDATRQHAKDKLNAFTDKIGYPSKWRDYSALRVDRGPFVLNVLRAHRFAFDWDIHKIGKPVDRTEWGMTPPTVNAYYNPAMNEIVFPAGILQPPFFDPKADDAVNYGGIGAVIGHEMTHGFDDQGAQYDPQGNLRNWWTKADLQNFKARTLLIQKEYEGFAIAPGVHENGALVTGESLADLGGLTLALRAYEKSLEGKPRPADIDGFTPEQRFFLAYAQVWATNMRPQFERLLIATDPHPLPKFRVNGTVSNMPAFAEAWHLAPTDPMVLPPDKRTQIW